MMKEEIADSAQEEPNYNGYKAEMALPVVGTGDSRRTWQRPADIQHWDSSETTNGCAFPTHDGRGKHEIPFQTFKKLATVLRLVKEVKFYQMYAPHSREHGQ